MHLNLWGSGEVDLEEFLRDDAGAVEGVVEPEVGGQRVVSRGGDDAVFEEVAGSEAEDADGFDADVLVGGSVDDGGIGIVGDGAGEDVDGAAAVDVHAGMDFFAAVPIGFESVAGFEELNLSGVWGFGRSRSHCAGFLFWLLPSLLRLCERKNNGDNETTYCECARERMEAEMKSQEGLAGSVGRGRRCVKRWLRPRCRICTAR